GPVTALALHVVVPLVARGRKAACLGRQVAQLVHRVAVLAEWSRVAAALQRRPCVGVCRLLPLPLEAHVTVAADRQVRLLVRQTYEPLVPGRNLPDQIPVAIDNPLVH